MCVPFLVGLGSTMTKASKKATQLGGFLGTIATTVVLIDHDVVLLATMPLVYDKATPLVVLGTQIHVSVSALFAIVIFLGIYSTASPMIWSVADQVSTKNPSLHKPVALFLTLLALIGGATLPFGQLVGLVYPFVVYYGAFMMFCAIVHQTKSFMKRNKAIDHPEKEVVGQRH